MKRSSTTRYKGVSKKAIVHTSRIGGRESTVLTSGKQNEREAAAQEKRRTAIQGLCEDDRQAIAQMDILMHGSADDVDAVTDTVPLGEEGIETSHEGGEYEVFENLVKEIGSSARYQRADYRTRRDRTELQTAHWVMQIDELVNSYLSFRSNCGYDGMANRMAPAEPKTPPSVITIEVVDLFFRKTVSLPVTRAETYPNETLLRNGYLGCSPLTPTIAIAIRSLSAFRQMHRTCPRFSIDAFSKMLCHLHNVPFQGYLQKQLIVAFDIYLEICRRVDKKLNKELGYNNPRARLIRQCPPCFLKLQGEPDLEFSVMVSMDGNNSLKRIGASVRVHDELFDSRAIDSDRWLTVDEVDEFKHEVAERPEKGVNPDEAAANNGTNCAERWKNAGPDQLKRMFTLFDETGIFIAACRHRTILYACDMIQSGELFAKYPLAIINRMMNELGEKRIGCAYDIGCSFHRTLSSSILGPCAQASEFRLMVGAFHGYAHNRSCQLAWHPLYMKGTGRTEGEGCEHIFSSSNDLARNTRHSSRFHRHQAITEHFQFWDQDKYALLSAFIANHYHQAVQVIEDLEHDLESRKKDLECDNNDFEHFFSAEKEYLSNLEQPDPVVEAKKAYVASLRQLAFYKQEWEKNRQHLMNVCLQLAATGDNRAVAQATYETDISNGRLQNAQAIVILNEAMLGVTERWTETSVEYKKYYKENIETSFRKAVDELERAVVMRIWELTKMKATGTGYKLRQHIAKALNRRSDAVRKSIKRYNEQASYLDPPAPSISWEQIADYAFIGEFDLLRISRSDIRGEKWTQKTYREAAVKYFKLCRAREELQRLNVEIRRLRAFINEEAKHMEDTIRRLSVDNPLLADELRRQWALRSNINTLHLQRLKQLEHQSYYTGSRDTGEGIETESIFPLNAMEQDDQIQEEIEQDRDFETVTDFIANIVD